MRVIVTFSGGKDSLAALLWTREHITKNFTTVFCDTGWEHPLTYEYIHRIADKLHLDLVTLKSKKYDGMVDLCGNFNRFGRVEDLQLASYKPGTYCIQNRTRVLTNVYM